MNQAKTITADTSGIISVGQTLSQHAGFSWATNADADFGGGTLSLFYRPANHLGNGEWMELDTPAEAEQATYMVGQNMEIGLQLADSTEPDVTYLIGYVA
jgi:hypothetical protein